MPICVLKRVDLFGRMSSSENEGRFLHQNEVNFVRQRNKMAAKHELYCMHLHREPNANTKLDLCFPIVDRNKRKLDTVYQREYACEVNTAMLVYHQQQVSH